jgi:hypothetical protein
MSDCVALDPSAIGQIIPELYFYFLCGSAAKIFKQLRGTFTFTLFVTPPAPKQLYIQDLWAWFAPKATLIKAYNLGRESIEEKGTT